MKINSHCHWDAIVIGAGIAGTCTALGLARRNYSVLLLESKEVGRHKVCGEFLSPESSSVFRRLGAWDKIAEAGAFPTTTGQIFTPQRAGKRFSLPAPGWALARNVLDGILADACRDAGVEVRSGQKASAISPCGEGQSVDVGGEAVVAKTVILAAGRNSALSGDADTRVATRPPSAQARFLGIKTHMDGVGLPAGEVRLYSFGGGYCGLLGLPGDLVNVCALLPYTVARKGGPQSLWQEMLAGNPYLAQLMVGAQPAYPWLTTANVQFWHREPVRGGLICAGDCAGYIHPLTGDGMAMAARSGELAATVAHTQLQGWLPQKVALELYAAAWQREFLERLKWGGLFQGLLVHPLLASGALWTLGQWPSLMNRTVRLTRGHFSEAW